MSLSERPPKLDLPAMTFGTRGVLDPTVTIPHQSLVTTGCQSKAASRSHLEAELGVACVDGAIIFLLHQDHWLSKFEKSEQNQEQMGQRHMCTVRA